MHFLSLIHREKYHLNLYFQYGGNCCSITNVFVLHVSILTGMIIIEVGQQMLDLELFENSKC